MRLWDFIREAMLSNPNQVICESNAEMTYEEIVIFAEHFSKNLVGEKCCAIVCGSEMAASMALLSCFAANVAAVPLSVRYGQAHCGKILNTIKSTAVITDMDGELRILRFSDSDYIAPKVRPAVIMCTSGTTGNPKGIMLSDKNIISNVTDICKYFDIGANDTILISRPLYHCAVLTGEFLTSLIKGTRIRFYSDKFNPVQLLSLISDDSTTVFCGTPSMLGLMARIKEREERCPLKKISVSGEVMSAATSKAIKKAFSGADIYYVYGLTEAGPRVSRLPPELFGMCPYAVGYALDSVSLRVVKPNGVTAGDGEEGILWIKGDNIMLGYYNEPELTEKVLKDGWLCTGDIAVIEAGLLKIKGRSDDLIIRAGMNIYPQEIEEALKSDSRVSEVLVYGIDNRFSGTQIGMKISGDFSDTDEVRRLCVKLLPSFLIPSVIELVDDLPKNGSGKIIRRDKNA